jgi:hypothetical protein
MTILVLCLIVRSPNLNAPESRNVDQLDKKTDLLPRFSRVTMR